MRPFLLFAATFAVAIFGPVRAQGSLPTEQTGFGSGLADAPASQPYSAPPVDAGPVNPGTPGAPGVPIDGGLGLLALAGAGYAARRLRKHRGAAAVALLLGTAGAANAQAVLSPGDIAVVSYYTADDGSATGGDNFEIVTLADLPRNTTFAITDGGWNGTQIVKDAGAASGVLTYTAPCDVPAGTVFKYVSKAAPTAVSSATCPTNGPVPGSDPAAGFDVAGLVFQDVAAAGDQLLIYQDAANTGNQTGAGTAFQRFIYAATTKTAFVATGGTITDNTTKLPPLLTLGSTAIELTKANSVYNGVGTIMTTSNSNDVEVAASFPLRSGPRGQALINVGAVGTNWSGNDVNTSTSSGYLAPSQQLAFFLAFGNSFGTATAVGGPGWRNLSAPGSGLTVASLVNYNTTGINLIQGLSDELPVGTNGASLVPNIYTGFNGDPADNAVRSGGFRANNLGFVPPNNEAAALTPGMGILWYFYDVAAGPFAPAGQVAGTTTSKKLPLLLPVIGTEITADVPVTFTAAQRTSATTSAVSPNGFYFLGNPFLQPFDLSGLTVTTSPASLQSAFCFWDPNAGGPQVAAGNGTPGSYVIRNAFAADTPSANDTRDDVSVWQGFYGEVTGASAPAAFSFSAASRVADAHPGFYGRPAARAEALVAFQLAGETAEGATFDAAAQIRFSDAGAVVWDPYDLTKLGSMGAPSATLAPVGEGPSGEAGYALAQRSLPIDLQGAVETPLRLEVSGTDGTFALAWTLTDVPDAWALTLRDVVTGAVVDMRTHASYAFEAAAGTRDRFVVSAGARAVAGEATAASDALALSAPRPNPATAQSAFRLTAPAGVPVSVAVFDALGRRVAVLFDGAAGAATETLRVDTASLAPGVYTVRAVAGDQVASRRLAVVR